jgi:hypothetical protein
MPEHRLAGIASPKMTAVDRMPKHTTGKVVAVREGAEASDVRITAQSADYGLMFHRQDTRSSSDFDHPLDQWLEQSQHAERKKPPAAERSVSECKPQ